MALSKVVTLTVYGHTVRLSNPIRLFQNDQLYLIFEILQYGIDVKDGDENEKYLMPINPLNATLYFETPVGVDSIESAEIVDNKIIFHLETKYTQNVGKTKVQIKLTDEECCQVTLPYFDIEIKENIYDNAPLLRSVLLADENDAIVIDENYNAINVATEVFSVPIDLSSEEFKTKQIQDFDLDLEVSGREDILIQDEGVTKRIKANKLIGETINNNIDLTNYYTKEEVDNEFIFTTDMATVSTLGGISAGTNLNNLSIQEVLTKLLFPYVAPTLSASLIYSPSGTIFEKGQSVNITGIRGTVTKKSEKIKNVKFLDGSTVINTITGGVENGGNFQYNLLPSISITSNLSNNRFRFTATDMTDKTYYANTTAINFYYPYYYGFVEENELITGEIFSRFTKKVEAKGNKTFNYNTENQCMLFAYPKSYGNIAKIIDPNGFDVTSTFTKIEIEVVGLDQTSQVYYVYTNNASTVSNFKMTFQY